MWITSSPTLIKSPTRVALGNFDGIHQGHRAVIEPIFQSRLPESGSIAQPTLAAVQSLTCTGNRESPHYRLDENSAKPVDAARSAVLPTVVTFSPHPREFFSGERRPLLTPLSEKTRYLEDMGVEQLVLLSFDQELASLTPQEFVEKILVQSLQAQFISVGEDFCFGKQRSGTTAELQAIAAQFGITTNIVSLQTHDGERISSSAIREALQHGRLDRATQLLGRPYALLGKVVQGQQLGRTIGVPTANLQLPAEKFLPKFGVYSVWVNAETASDRLLPGVMNIGNRPTVNGVEPTVEVHLLDWAGDLYEQTLIVHLVQFLRPEQKFASLEALKAQIQVDCTAARAILNS